MTTPDTPDLSRRPKGATDVVSQRTGDANVLLNLASGAYFSLEDVGADVWDRCTGDETVDEIVAAVAEKWSTGREIVEPDVLDLLGELEQAGLINYV